MCHSSSSAGLTIQQKFPAVKQNYEDSGSSKNHLWGSYVTAGWKQQNGVPQTRQTTPGSTTRHHATQQQNNSVPRSSSDEMCSRWSKAAATSQYLQVQTSPGGRKAPRWPAATALLPYVATLTHQGHHGDVQSSYYSLMTCVWINEHER